MNQNTSHIITLGWTPDLIDNVWTPIVAKVGRKVSHVVHPSLAPTDWPEHVSLDGVHFFQQSLDREMPEPDITLLAALEREDVPTIHNMILGDRVVSQLSYADGLRYSSFLARKMIDLFSTLRPSLVIGAYDGVHGSMALAVCRYLNIPWFCFHFGVIPYGTACFCDRMSPAARVDLGAHLDEQTLLNNAHEALIKFEEREIQAPAYIAPKPRSLLGKLAAIPAKIKPLIATLKRGQRREQLKYSELPHIYSVRSVLQFYWSSALARRALFKKKMLQEPPAYPYVFFGLHMQPESTVDVWAHFYSNQLWVLELLARSIPPTHKLLIKIHKSDLSGRSREQLDAMTALPGVQLVAPFADAQQFIRNADLVVSIQGTIGLEGALFGKPVIMLGESPNVIFGSVSGINEITDLPQLVKRKLREPQADRATVVRDYAKYLAPFMPASNNIWTERKTATEIDGYIALLKKLDDYVARQQPDTVPTEAKDAV